jgi:hypothetical protein
MNKKIIFENFSETCFFCFSLQRYYFLMYGFNERKTKNNSRKAKTNIVNILDF